MATTPLDPHAQQTDPEALHLRVPRTARYYLIGTPGPHIRRVWMVLHGYGMLARYFLRKFRSLDDGHTLVCAPEALSRFYLGENQWDRVGATWMTKEDRQHEIEDQRAYLDALLQTLRAQISPAGGPLPALTLLGFSQGTATAWRWLEHSPLLPSGTLSHLVLWAGSMPPEPVANPERWAGLPLTYVYGHQDEYLTDARVVALQAILAATGAAVRYVSYDGGHAIDEAVLASIA